MCISLAKRLQINIEPELDLKHEGQPISMVVAVSQEAKEAFGKVHTSIGGMSSTVRACLIDARGNGS